MNKILSKSKNSIVTFTLFNFGILFLYCVISLFLTSLSVLVFGITSQIILAIISMIFYKVDFKFAYTAYIFGLIFTSIMFYSLIENHGVPYINSHGSDDLFFETEAINKLNNNDDVISFFTNNSQGIATQLTLYVYILSKLVIFADFIDGYHLFISRQFNLLLVFLIIFMMTSIVKEKFNFLHKEENRLLYSLALFPNIFNISSYSFRDILSLFLVVLLFWGISQLSSRHNSLKTFIVLSLIILSITLQFYVRSFIMYIMIIIFMVNILSLVSHKYKIPLRIGISLSIVFLLFETFKNVIYDGVAAIDRYSEFRSNEETSSLVSIFTDAPLFPFGIFLRIVYGLVQPNPSFSYLFGNYALSYGIMTTIIGIGTLYILTQLPYFLVGLFKPLDKLSTTFFLVYMVFLSSLTFRHLIFIYPIMFIIIARGREKGLGKYKGLYKVYLSALLITYVLYSII